MQSQASDTSAADFLVEKLHAEPGQITVLALAACTNLALAIQKDPALPSKWQELVILGGAFNCSGNVNPAAEANILGDPEAADFVMQHAHNVSIVGLDITHSCSMSGAQLHALRGAARILPRFCAVNMPHMSVATCLHCWEPRLTACRRACTLDRLPMIINTCFAADRLQQALHAMSIDSRVSSHTTNGCTRARCAGHMHGLH